MDEYNYEVWGPQPVPIPPQHFNLTPGLLLRQEPNCLITDGIDDEATGATIFTEAFISRFGHVRPNFYQGTLKEAQGLAKQSQRLLAIYLHSDGGLQAESFCQRVLCNRPIVNFLAENCIAWAWDTTHGSNERFLKGILKETFGSCEIIENFYLGRLSYPMLLIVSDLEVKAVISSRRSEVEVLETLGIVLAQQRNRVQGKAKERLSVIQPKGEAPLKINKTEAGRKSKPGDSTICSKEIPEQQPSITIPDLRQEVPNTHEPGPEPKNPICAIRIRLPHSRVLHRKFLQSASLKTLYDILQTKGFPREEYKVLYSDPKVDLAIKFGDEELLGTIFQKKGTAFVLAR